MGSPKEIYQSEAFKRRNRRNLRKRKIDVEPFFEFLKANLAFTRMSVRGKSKVHNEMGSALMAVNIRKYTAINTENGIFSPED